MSTMMRVLIGPEAPAANRALLVCVGAFCLLVSPMNSFTDGGDKASFTGVEQRVGAKTREGRDEQEDYKICNLRCFSGCRETLFVISLSRSCFCCWCLGPLKLQLL